VAVSVATGATTVIAPPAEIDMASAGPLREQVLATDADQTIVIDMAEVTFCDSTGLAVLIAAREHVARGAGRLVLRDPGPAVRRLLVITQLEGVFEIEDSAAVEAEGAGD
jgi:anti-anti-sigma factor